MADADAADARKLTPLVKTHHICETKVTGLAQAGRKRSAVLANSYFRHDNIQCTNHSMHGPAINPIERP